MIGVRFLKSPQEGAVPGPGSAVQTGQAVRHAGTGTADGGAALCPWGTHRRSEADADPSIPSYSDLQ